MLAWRIWQAIQHPSRSHPLFRYTLLHARSDQPRITPIFFSWMFTCSGFGFCWALFVDWVPLALSVILLSLNGSLGLIWAITVSTSLARERELARYDLLTLLPIGPLSAAWALSAGTLHRRASFFWGGYLLRAVLLTLCFMLLGMLLLTLWFSSIATLNEEALRTNNALIPMIVTGLALMLGMLLDHHYSAAMAVVSGLYAASHAETGDEARMLVTLVFLPAQFSVYVLVVALVSAMPPLLRPLHLDPAHLALVQGICGIGLLVLLRAWLLKRLWLRVLWQQRAKADEVKQVLQSQPRF